MTTSLGSGSGEQIRPLSHRQEQILGAVVERFIASGTPVGSRHIAATSDIDFAASTVRYELARLEELGYLGHPHTSAGRVPTDRGYRYYVDELVPRGGGALVSAAALETAIDLGEMRKEVDGALQRIADAVSQLTSLLGVVTAPATRIATIRHVEVLLLQPQLVTVVVITSTGSVNKRMVAFDRPVDPGLVDWGKAVFNERLTGIGVGSRTIDARLTDSRLGVREKEFLDALAPALTEMAEETSDHLFVGGRARFVADSRQDIAAIDALMEQLEERYALLALLRRAMSRNEVYLHIGSELADPGLQGLSMVAANYGVARGNLGTISLFGPTRMDYRLAMSTVREAALVFSRYLEGVYE
jgi:heat-inducible transcriptional repressor